MTSIQTITLYKRGLNEILDGVLEEDDIVFIVQGSNGRVPILADTPEEAESLYLARGE